MIASVKERAGAGKRKRSTKFPSLSAVKPDLLAD